MSDANSLPDLRSGSVSAVLLLTNQDQVLRHYVRIHEEFFFSLTIYTVSSATIYELHDPQRSVPHSSRECCCHTKTAGPSKRDAHEL